MKRFKRSSFIRSVLAGLSGAGIAGLSGGCGKGPVGENPIVNQPRPDPPAETPKAEAAKRTPEPEKQATESAAGSEKVQAHLLKDDGTFPNNERLPLLVYSGAVEPDEGDPAATFENLFQSNQWGSSWRNGVYSFHHYHSTAHEVLGIYSGSVKVQLGGPDGITATVKAGDVVVIPAGVAHKNLGSSGGFRCVGAYPRGQSWDMNYGKDGERPKADQNIATVPLPQADPVFGTEGPLVKKWTPTT